MSFPAVLNGAVYGDGTNTKSRGSVIQHMAA